MRGSRSAKLVATVVGVVLLLASCSSGGPAPIPTPTGTPTPIPGASAPPNIVYVLTDDLSSDLVPYMPHVEALERAGITFTNYTVTDSLCCPSRASILTGEFPHDTGVFANSGPYGGFNVFHRRGEERYTFATALQARGYRTALLGKYLNGYHPSARAAGSSKRTWVPPGWSTWDASGYGYGEFDYKLNENHRVVHYGTAAKDYMVDVLQGMGRRFIASSAAARKPFLLEVAPFDPHAPYVPAPRDAHSFAGLHAPRGASFDRLPEHAPGWLARRHPLTPPELAQIDAGFRRRVQAVQSVDRMIGALEQELAQTGQASNTVFVFNSDNGLHMGQYRLTPGKFTAFDSDVNVPLVVSGPGIRAGTTNTAVVQNVDLAPTFEELAGLRAPSSVDGRSIVPLLRGDPVKWRRYGLIEHHGRDFPKDDPDFQSPDSGNPPTYAAMRTSTFTYVRYGNGEREYYDRRTDPDELDNTYADLSHQQQDALGRAVERLESCHGSTQCWAAGRG